MNILQIRYFRGNAKRYISSLDHLKTDNSQLNFLDVEFQAELL